MARRVFFSFKYEPDVFRAMVVRNSWVTQGKEATRFVDAANFEKLKKQGDSSKVRMSDLSSFAKSRTNLAFSASVADISSFRSSVQ